MIRIKQEDSTGCGFACIAMLADTSYGDVRNLAVSDLGFEESGTFYTHGKDLIKLATSFKIKLGKKRDFTDLDDLPNKAVLAINYKQKSDTWHWCLYIRTEDDQYIYDPRKEIKTDKRKDFGRIKIKWFLPVLE